MSLQQKTTAGFFWTVGQQISVQAINFAVLIILARVLSPFDFGLIAMLQIFIAIGMVLMDSGMTSSLIRTKNISNRDYSTVFYLNLAISAVIYLVIFLSAPLIASFFHQPALTNITRVYALSFVIQALVSVQNTRLTRDMNFRLQMFLQLPATIIGGISGIWFALHGYGAWSLVYMNLIRTFVFMLQHWIFTDWRPIAVFDRQLFKQHFKFGYKLTLIGIINTLYNNIYDIIIGRVFAPLMLGFYNQANTLSLFPVQLISGALDKVTYPAFAQIQDEDARLRVVYARVMQQVIFWIAPMMLLLMICAEPLFRVVLTDKWLPAVPYFQILCIYAIMYPLQVYNINILNVKGRSDLLLRIEIIKKITGIAGTIICGIIGIYPLLWFKVGYGFFLFYMNTFYSGRLINYSMRAQLNDILPIIAKAIIVFGIVMSLDFAFWSARYYNDISRMGLNMVCFGIVYFLLAKITKTPALTDFWLIIRQRSFH